MTNEELYNEEQRQILLELNNVIKKQSETLDRQNELLTSLVEKYVAPKDEVTVKGNIEVNTETEVEVTNLDKQTQTLVDTIKGTVQKPVESVTVKNIKDAQTEAVTIKNIQPLQEKLDEVIASIVNQDTSVNVTKEELKIPNTAKDYMSVRLTDGKKFYNAVSGMVNALQGLPIVTSTVTGGLALAVANADGSAVTGGTTTADGAFDFMDGNDLQFMDGNDAEFMSG